MGTPKVSDWFTTSDSDSGRIVDRLCSWGLGEVTVKRMAGRVFLKNSELLEIFTEILPWSESFRTPERVVWIELCGIPPHCWNHYTFKRIAELPVIWIGKNDACCSY
ncbi:hypothetical protein GQ457_14G026260 [Hibiscus cannabinus]